MSSSYIFPPVIFLIFLGKKDIVTNYIKENFQSQAFFPRFSGESFEKNTVIRG